MRRERMYLAISALASCGDRGVCTRRGCVMTAKNSSSTCGLTTKGISPRTPRSRSCLAASCKGEPASAAYTNTLVSSNAGSSEMVIDLLPAERALHPKIPDGKRTFPCHCFLWNFHTLDSGLGYVHAAPKQLNQLRNQLRSSLRQIVHINALHVVSFGVPAVLEQKTTILGKCLYLLASLK